MTLPAGRRDFYVQGLADSGQIPVTLEIQNARGQMLLTLAPSGIAWASERLKLQVVNGSGSAKLGAYVLDPATLTALAAEQPLPSTAAVTFVSSDPTVAIVNSTSLSKLDGTIVTRGAGETDISIVQPLGFTAPVGHGTLHVIVPQAAYAASVGSLGRGLQTTVNLRSSSSANSTDPPTYTLTSGDPSKLLLSLSPTDPPVPSVTVQSNPNHYPSAYLPVYAHALDGPVDVKLTASNDGYADASIVVAIQRSSVMIVGYGGSITNATYNVTTQSPLDLNLAHALAEGHRNNSLRRL